MNGSDEERNRLVAELRSTEHELVKANEQVGHLEIRLKDHDANVNNPDDGHTIVKRAATEIRSSRNEARIAKEELHAARGIFNQKIEQIRAEHKDALDQSKSVISSLKSEVNNLTIKVEELARTNAKLLDRPVDITLNKTVAPMHQTVVGNPTPAGTPARSLSPSLPVALKSLKTCLKISQPRSPHSVPKLTNKPSVQRAADPLIGR